MKNMLIALAALAVIAASGCIGLLASFSPSNWQCLKIGPQKCQYFIVDGRFNRPDGMPIGDIRFTVVPTFSGVADGTSCTVTADFVCPPPAAGPDYAYASKVFQGSIKGGACELQKVDQDWLVGRMSWCGTSTGYKSVPIVWVDVQEAAGICEGKGLSTQPLLCIGDETLFSTTDQCYCCRPKGSYSCPTLPDYRPPAITPPAVCVDASQCPSGYDCVNHECRQATVITPPTPPAEEPPVEDTTITPDTPVDDTITPDGQLPPVEPPYAPPTTIGSMILEWFSNFMSSIRGLFGWQ